VLNLIYVLPISFHSIKFSLSREIWTGFPGIIAFACSKISDILPALCNGVAVRKWGNMRSEGIDLNIYLIIARRFAVTVEGHGPSYSKNFRGD
jgi:hypothetical protein